MDPYQTRLGEEVISLEGFGTDGVPDLLYLNYTVIDMVGHIWSLNSRQMRDTIRMQNQHLAVLIDILNRDVGEGQWAMVMTSTTDPPPRRAPRPDPRAPAFEAAFPSRIIPSLPCDPE